MAARSGIRVMAEFSGFLIHSFDLLSLTTIISFFSHIFGASLDFIVAAYSALPLPVIVGLAYRIGELVYR